MPPKSPQRSKLKSYAKFCSTAVVTLFLSSGLGGGSGGPGGLPKEGHWIMVYEYRYGHGYKKRKDQRTEF